MDFNYWEDGLNHINIITFSKNPDVRKLNDIAYNPFTHPEYGEFNCIRAIFYWLSLETPTPSIRIKYGDALYRGTSKRQKHKVDKLKIYRECVEILLNENLEFRKAFLAVIKLDLPIVSYRYLGNTCTKNKYQSELIKIYNELKQKVEDGHAIFREVD